MGALSSRASTPIVARTGLAPPKKVGHSIFGLEMYLFPLSQSLSFGSVPEKRLIPSLTAEK